VRAIADFTVCGEAGVGAEASRMVGEMPPDLLLLDLSMPSVDGLRVLSELAEFRHRTKILLLTGAIEPDELTIVGSAEADPAAGRISAVSPVGRALLGKKKGEKVLVRVPAGDVAYKIVTIT